MCLQYQAKCLNGAPAPTLSPTRPSGLLDDGVRFLPGFFNVSLGPVFGPAAVEAAEDGGTASDDELQQPTRTPSPGAFDVVPWS